MNINTTPLRSDAAALLSCFGLALLMACSTPTSTEPTSPAAPRAAQTSRWVTHRESLEIGPLLIARTTDSIVVTYLGAASNTLTQKTVAVERHTDGAYLTLQGYTESGLLTLTSSNQVVYSCWLRVIGVYSSSAVTTSFVAVPGTRLPVPLNIPASTRDSLVLAAESGETVALPTTNPVIPWFGMPPDGLSTATVWHYYGRTGTYHLCRSKAILRHPVFSLRHAFPILVVQVIIPNLINGFVSPTVRHLVDSKTIALVRPNGSYDFGLIQKNDQLAFVCTTPGMYTIHWLPGYRIVARDTFHYPIQHNHTPPGNYAITVWGSQLAAEEGTARSEGGYDHVVSSTPIRGGGSQPTRDPYPYGRFPTNPAASMHPIAHGSRRMAPRSPSCSILLIPSAWLRHHIAAPK